MRKCIANTYEIVARIGSGNSGIVYKAYQKSEQVRGAEKGKRRY